MSDRKSDPVRSGIRSFSNAAVTAIKFLPETECPVTLGFVA